MINKTSLVRWGRFSQLSDRKEIIGGVLIAIAWFYLNISSLIWLFASLQDTALFNQAIFVATVATVAFLGVRYRQQIEFSYVPQLQLSPSLLMLGCGIGAIAIRWLLDIEQVSVLLFVLGTYGLAGLFISPNFWRKGLPVAVLFACILPFSLQFSVGLGFPIRVLTAYAVEHILNSWQIAAVSSHEIIVLENGIAQVDLPCSGLKSLWTGTLFLLAATWLENRQIRWRWLLVCSAHLLLLISANIGRVLLLVLIANVFDRPELAQIVHVPLGILGFSSACFFTWLLLQNVPINLGTKVATIQTKSAQADLKKKELILCALLIGLSLLPKPEVILAEPLALNQINLPARMELKSIPLTKFERNFFAEYPQTIAQKQRFKSDNLSGSILLVSTTSWQAHHAPELCFVGNGFAVEQMNKERLSPEVIGRWLSLENGQMNAVYWFQSNRQTTDEFISRFWSDVTRQQKSWTLVSVLFDEPEKVDSSEVREFVSNIHREIANSL
ncbi:MAG: exosortase O [Cyanosarcina radialis HA8281-LM2]|jgi:exosortase O|nr:exosortase O [Cyanosarcina radialis HA8281-LM2]